MNDDARISSERDCKNDSRVFYTSSNLCRAFTIIELLVVIAIIAVLAAMIIPSLNRGGCKWPNVPCMNNLRQIGLSLVMYSSDHNIYPSSLGSGPPFKTWADQLATYNPVKWTNVA